MSEAAKALPDVARAMEEWLFNGASDAETVSAIHALLPSPECVELRAALRQCQRTLAMMTDPGNIRHRQTTVIHAYHECVDAEVRARKLLGEER